jgi:hypothetical protein
MKSVRTCTIYDEIMVLFYCWSFYYQSGTRPVGRQECFVKSHVLFSTSNRIYEFNNRQILR